jgi:transcription elongation factor GreA
MLASAASLSDVPHDPETVELGDTVSVRPSDGGNPERYTIVGGLEARLDEERISERSPPGTALLGERVGDEVEVKAPGGVNRWRVTAIERSG